MSRYAWIITKDHLAEPGDTHTDVGTSGPRAATQQLLDLLDAGKGHHFTMYDDDGERYVEGRLIVAPGHGDVGDDEDFCEAPLRDYGYGGLGATEIRWTGHKEWDIG